MKKKHNKQLKVLQKHINLGRMFLHLIGEQSSWRLLLFLNRGKMNLSKLQSRKQLVINSGGMSDLGLYVSPSLLFPRAISFLHSWYTSHRRLYSVVDWQLTWNIISETAAVATQLQGAIVPAEHGQRAYVERVPFGVVLGIAREYCFMRLKREKTIIHQSNVSSRYRIASLERSFDPRCPRFR